MKEEAAIGARSVVSRFEETTSRYIRVNMKSYANNSTNFSIREAEVRYKEVVIPNSKLVKTKFPTRDNVISDFDVLDFGADAKGIKDSTSAIQETLYACYDAGGGTVWLPAGSYRVTDTIEIGSFCTLRGDHLDPDQGKGDYGTVIKAELPPGDNGPTLFRIGGSAGVMGLTTYYPNQNAENPIPYNYTFEIPGLAWIGNENYMMSTISDVTMLNSYRGIGISTMPNDRGDGASAGQVHESATIRNVKGTVLYQGAVAYNGADVGTWENVVFDNKYWANAGKKFNAPDIKKLNDWTRTNGTAFVLGDLEWEQFYKLKASEYNIGIHVVPGQRIRFTGTFLNTDIRNTNIAVKVDDADSRWGLAFGKSVLEGSEYSILNSTAAYVRLTDTELVGPKEGIIHELSGTMPDYPEGDISNPAKPLLFDVSKAPYNAQERLDMSLK